MVVQRDAREGSGGGAPGPAGFATVSGSMLLTLSTSSLRPLLAGRHPKLRLGDLPTYAREELGLHGLNLSTDLLKGASRETLEGLRERADKAACACLLLIESDPQPIASLNDSKGDNALERTERVLNAAHLLGCNAAAIRMTGEDSEEAFDLAIERLKMALDTAERLELNLLIAPEGGFTGDPERVTELIKKVGRFRLMTFPDFAAAAQSDDPAGYLRRLAPYAGAVGASTIRFATEPAAREDEDGMQAWGDLAPDAVEHTGYDLRPMLDAVRSVGFDGSLGLDYRGEGDVTIGLLMSRAAIESAIEEAEAAS